MRVIDFAITLFVAMTIIFFSYSSASAQTDGAKKVILDDSYQTLSFLPAQELIDCAGIMSANVALRLDLSVEDEKKFSTARRQFDRAFAHKFAAEDLETVGLGSEPVILGISSIFAEKFDYESADLKEYVRLRGASCLSLMISSMNGASLEILGVGE